MRGFAADMLRYIEVARKVERLHKRKPASAAASARVLLCPAPQLGWRGRAQVGCFVQAAPALRVGGPWRMRCWREPPELIRR
jgi:hypothetical protein